MRNVYEVLRQKEMDLERVRREVNALRQAVPLLVDGADALKAEAASPQNNRWPLKVPEGLQPIARR